MIIRAVTLFYPPVEGGRVNVDELRQELMKLRNVISNVSKRRGD